MCHKAVRRGLQGLALAAALLSLPAVAAVKDVPLDVEERVYLWPKGKIPDFDARQGEAVLEVVTVPAVRSEALAIVIGGGSYQHLPFVYDPADMVATLVSNGIRCVNLRHRCPRPKGKPKHLSAWQDVQRAVRICRTKADRWKVNPEKIGVIGFSAGGHCALLAAVSSRTAAYEPIDELDRLSCHVNFAVLAYPAYVLDGFDNLTHGFADARRGREKDWSLPLGSELKFDASTPPVYLLHGETDALVPVMGTVIVFHRLLQMNVPVQMQVFTRQGHGFEPAGGWRNQVIDWMRVMHLL